MIRFEVTGATPEEFAENAMKAWGLLAIGLQRAINAAIPAIADGLSTPPTSPASTTSSPPLQAQTNGSESSSSASRGDPTDADVDAVMEMQRRGAIIGQKIEERQKVHSDKVDDLFVETPSTQPTGNTEAKPATSKNSKSTKGPKLDDLKTRLSEVIVAATARWDQKRANHYARTLLKEFGVEKISDLPNSPDLALFMARSERYLTGAEPERT